MPYIENPKTKGSGIICCIPQTGICPNKCEDCFFQSGRSYLEPLDDNLPNMPSLEEAAGRVIRVNDGNDSSVQRHLVMEAVQKYPDRFYNTAIPKWLAEFDAPVVLTVNPADMTDTDFYIVDDPVPPNLMFVRIRTNVWNLESVVEPAIEYYAERKVPIVLTFMAYHEHQAQFDEKSSLCGGVANGDCYVYRPRTLNSYYAIKTDAWQKVMDRYRFNQWVYGCNKIEGVTFACHRCGNCLREYYATKERIRSLTPPYLEE
jgi:hypothetical protein